MFAHLFSRIMRSPLRFSHAQSHSLRFATSPYGHLSLAGVFLGLVGAAGTAFSLYAQLSLLPLIFTVAGAAILPSALCLGAAFVIQRVARHAIKEVGPFFGVKLEEVGSILRSAEADLKLMNLPADSESARLFRAAESAYQSSIFAAESLADEMLKCSPEFKKRVTSMYWAYNLERASELHAETLTLLPSSLRTQIELFVESLAGFKKFKEVFKVSLELELKPKVVTADISEYLNASASLAQGLEEVALHASVDSSARAELEDFLDLQLKSGPEVYPSRAAQELS